MVFSLWQSEAHGLCPHSLCLPQLCQTGEEDRTNLAKHLKEGTSGRGGASNDIPQGSSVGAYGEAMASLPCTRVTRSFSLACPGRSAGWSPSKGRERGGRGVKGDTDTKSQASSPKYPLSS